MLSVYILLLGGYSHSYCPPDSFTPGKYFQNLTADEFPADTHCEEADQFANPAPTDAREASEKLKAVEIQEDEDSQTFRKQQLFARLLVVAFFADANRLAAIFPQPELPFCPHFSYASPEKFIVHRVIRI